MPSINTELGERALSKMQHEMDWKPLKERCLRMYPAWSSRHVDRILGEYQRFLALKVATRDVYDTIVLAPMLLDAVWKQHILSTQQYYADCQLLLQANQILHYNADASVNICQSVREKRMELTKASLCMMFSGMYPLSSDSKGIWDYEESQESTMNSGLSSLAGEEQEDTTDGFNTGTEEETEVEASPPKPRSPRNDRERERQRKSKIPIKVDGSVDDNKEDWHRVLYIYRAGKVSKLSASSNDTIKNIKVKIHRKTGISPQQQFLEWDGLALEEARTVGHYGIPSDATLVLSRVKSMEHEQPINNDILKGEEMPTEGHDDSEHNSPEERDQPDERPKRRSGSPGKRNGNPTSRRSRPQSPPPMSPRSPRPPKPPRKQIHHQTRPYSPTKREDDSYISSSAHSGIHSPSVDPRRRQRALLNKMKIQSRDQDDHHQDNQDGHLHRDNLHKQHHEDSSLEPQSTVLSRPRPKPSPSIKVFVNTIMGFTITLTAKSSDTVDHLKQLIEEQEDIPFRKQILILEGVPLEDSQLLADYTSDSSLHVLLRLQAGSNSVASVAASTMTPSTTMATTTRKKNQNKILSRTTVASTVIHTGVGTSKWR